MAAFSRRGYQSLRVSSARASDAGSGRGSPCQRAASSSAHSAAKLRPREPIAVLSQMPAGRASAARPAGGGRSRRSARRPRPPRRRVRRRGPAAAAAAGCRRASRSRLARCRRCEARCSRLSRSKVAPVSHSWPPSSGTWAIRWPSPLTACGQRRPAGVRPQATVRAPAAAAAPGAKRAAVVAGGDHDAFGFGQRRALCVAVPAGRLSTARCARRAAGAAADAGLASQASTRAPAGPSRRAHARVRPYRRAGRPRALRRRACQDSLGPSASSRAADGRRSRGAPARRGAPVLALASSARAAARWRGCRRASGATAGRRRATHAAPAGPPAEPRRRLRASGGIQHLTCQPRRARLAATAAPARPAPSTSTATGRVRPRRGRRRLWLPGRLVDRAAGSRAWAAGRAPCAAWKPQCARSSRTARATVQVASRVPRRAKRATRLERLGRPHLRDCAPG